MIFLGILWVSDCLILLVDRQRFQSQWAMGHRRSRILRHPLAICRKLAEENVLVKHLPDLPALNRGSKLNHLHNSTPHKDNHCWGAKPHQVICIAYISQMESTVGAGARNMRHDENLVAKSVAAAKTSPGRLGTSQTYVHRDPVTVLGSGRPQV